MALVAGVDLSGRTRGTTAVAFLTCSQRGDPEDLDVVANTKARDDAYLLNSLNERQPSLVAIDAPLSLPHPVTCTESDCPICFADTGAAPRYTVRACELQQEWARIGLELPALPMPTVMLAGIAFRAIYLARVLRRRGSPLIETWPSGVYRVLERLQGRRASKPITDHVRHALLAEAFPRVEVPKTGTALRDRLDAVAAAYTAACRIREPSAAVLVRGDGLTEDEEDGIWIPAPEPATDS